MAINRGLLLLGAAGLGAGLMYLLDPEAGRSRRARMRQQAAGVTNDATQAIGSKARDIKNRAGGLVAESKELFRKGGDERSQTVQ